MTKIDIFDPATCCSSGVCGENVDQEVIDAAAAVSAPFSRHTGFGEIRVDRPIKNGERETLNRHDKASHPFLV